MEWSLYKDLELAFLLASWILFVTVALTKWLYKPLSRFGHNRAVYFNRKIIHVLGGGVAAVAVPHFSNWVVPTAAAILLAIILYIPRRAGRLMWWFQMPDNAYEVSFAVMWGVVVALSWGVLGDWRPGVLAALFMAVGDSATGVVRNFVFGRRIKHWIGNLAMAAVCIPIGWAYLGLIGALAGVLASVVERFEYPPIDDNVIVPLTTFLFLAIYKFYPL
ncbi:MAG: dolichol kinase [Pyrobaculum sp.]